MRNMKKLLLLLSLLLPTSSLFADIYDPTGALGIYTPNAQVSGSLGGLNATVVVPLAGRPGVGYRGTSGGLVTMQLAAELSFDGGTNWITTQFVNPYSGATIQTLVYTAGIIDDNQGIALTAGATHARVRVSSYTSGTVTATVRATAIPSANKPQTTIGQTYPAVGDAAGFKAVGGASAGLMREASVWDTDIGVGEERTLGCLLRKPGSGGSVDFGTSTDPVRVDPTGTTTQPVSGTVSISGVVTTKNDVVAVGTATWSSATGINTAVTITTTGYGTGVISIGTSAGTFFGGAVNFEVDDGGGVWYSILGVRANSFTTESSYLLPSSDSKIWQFGIAGFTQFRIRLNPAITGTGTVNIRIQASNAGVAPAVATGGGTVSSNISQFGGNNVVTGTGAGGAGIPRVTVSNDSAVKVWDGTTVVGVIAGTTAAKTDLSSVAGTATVTAAAGVQKVGAVGNAGAAFDAANNAAMPANALSMGAQTQTIDTSPTAATAGNLRYLAASTEGVAYTQEGGPKRFSCFVQAVTVTTQCQAAPAAGLRAYVTSVHFSNQAATVQTLDVIYGTGANCATGPTAISHKWQMGTNATTTSPQSIEASFPTPLVPVAANAICIRPSAASAFGATVTGFIAP